MKNYFLILIFNLMLTTLFAQSPQMSKDSISTDSLDINYQILADSLSTVNQKRADSIAIARVYLDSIGKFQKSQVALIDSLKQSSAQKDSLQSAQINQQQSLLDSLQTQVQDQNEESSQWKARFLWQLPLTLGLFILGFGIGGGHFP